MTLRFPTATYRVQFNRTFTFHDARAIVPYLARLGISHLYASPIFAAREGSLHGYDVVDFSRLNPELGSESDFEGLVCELRAHGLGIIVDIVPNHMGVATNANRWWNDVLARGRESHYADFFDIDWDSGGGKVLLPVLGDLPERERESGTLRLVTENGESFIAYHDRRFPLAERYDCAESDRSLEALLECQHYRLAYWKSGVDSGNYRRFFEVSDLAALNMDKIEVFTETHRYLGELIARGLIDGVRVDHPDGLADPKRYLDRLQQAFGRSSPDSGGSPAFYTVVEKILAADETLPEAWPVHGTTGYDFLNVAMGVFVDRGGELKLTELQPRGGPVESEQGGPDDRVFEETAYRTKRLVLRMLFSAELSRLVSLFESAGSERTARSVVRDELESALEELIAVFPVYRTYFASSSASKAGASDRLVLDRAVDRALGLNPSCAGAFEFIRAVLVDGESVTAREAAIRFQQLTAPVTAKGVEDTAFYRYLRLTSLNEVGGDPGRFGARDDAAHRYFVDRARRHPHALSPLSTHDTKRSSDTRCRISVLSQIPEEWGSAVERWRKANDPHRIPFDGHRAPTRSEEYLLYQTMVGSWPTPDGAGDYSSRIEKYLVKALREAKENTSWVEPRTDYERSVASFASRILGPGSGSFREDFARFHARVSRLGFLTSLGETLVQLAAPGAPDIYQGTELQDFSLVDPDNRRPVDFEVRKGLLSEISGVLELDGDARSDAVRAMLNERGDRLKLFVIAAVLAERKRFPDLYTTGDYIPLPVRGPRARNVFAFLRRTRDRTTLVAVSRFHAELEDSPIWNGTVIHVPIRMGDEPGRDVLTGAHRVFPGYEIPAETLLDELPVCLVTTSNTSHRS